MSRTEPGPESLLTSLTEHVVPLEAGAHVVAAAFLADEPVLALAEGGVLFGSASPRRAAPHPDAGILVAAVAANAVVTGGDDGRVVRTAADGSVETIADEKGRWIDALAATASGALAWSTGKRVQSRDERGKVRVIEVPSTAQGLAFAPKGYRLAVSHYNGVSLWFPNTEAGPDVLSWKGSHLDVTWSPDARFVVSSMQENALHGWRLPEKADMRMTGYPSKTRSFSWSADGHWLATSGADAAIVWPFIDKTGPMGKAPRECGVRPARVSKVAFHPKALVLGVGYEDGCVLLIRLTDAAELLVRAPTKPGDEVSALAWDGAGRRLAIGTADGAAAMLTLP
jgi:WD40 repeat protein